MKTNSKLSKPNVYRRQPKSYLDRYKKQNKASINVSQQTSFVSRESSNEKGISHRGSKIVEVFQRGNDPFKIKIEQEVSEQKIMQNQFLEAEIMWFQKINQVKTEIEKIRTKSALEQKTVRQLQKERENKKMRLTELKEKLDEANRASQQTAVEDNYDKITNLQDEYDKFVHQKEEELAILREDRGKIMQQNSTMLHQIQGMKTQIQSLSQYEAQNYHTSLSSLLEQEDNLQQQIKAIESQNGKIEQKLKQIQQKKPLSEEVHRKYLQLYEKMLVNRQLDKFQNLMKLREQEMGRLEDYQRKRSLFSQMKKEVDLREKRTLQKQRLIFKLENQIKEKSTTLMILVNEEQEQQFRR